MIGWTVSRSTEEAFGLVNIRSTITVKAQTGFSSKGAAGSCKFCVSDLIARFRRELMTRPRLTIAQLMALILYVGLGFAAL